MIFLAFSALALMALPAAGWQGSALLLIIGYPICKFILWDLKLASEIAQLEKEIKEEL